MNRSAIVIMISLVAALSVPAIARADDAPYLGWSTALPPLPASFAPSEAEDCAAGRDQCVAAVIREMDRRLDDLAESCDHNAVFALAYLRTTEEYQRTIQDRDFFEDTAFVNHEDAVFAAYYFDAFDAWDAGRPAPPAWKIAFDAASRREVSGAGNLVLGMNAHIQNDLPFVLAALGLVKPDGSTRKRDHDRVNVFLNRVPDDMVPEIARRFDPKIDDGDVPTDVDAMVKFQSVPAWREVAWRNAERLVTARTAEERAMVTAEIEAYAASQALLLQRATAYLPALQSSDARDAYCADHGG